MRLFVALVVMLFAGSCELATPYYPLYVFQGDLDIRIAVCEFQVRCLDGECLVKWNCPYGFKN